MPEEPIKFSDGDAYEVSMGVWSRLVGDEFLDWLDVPGNRQWVDIGCGNGAFTEQLVMKNSPSSVWGIDISEGQLDYARKRLKGMPVEFEIGSAVELPYSTSSRDIAVMALVLFFSPDPRKSVEEMRRVVRAGGIVASYAWDVLGGGFPFNPVQQELAAKDIPFPLAPRVDVSPLEVTRQLWVDEGFEDIQSRVIRVTRTFDSFDHVWSTYLASSIGRILEKLDDPTRSDIKSRVCAKLSTDDEGKVRHSAWANCVKGRVPKS